MWCYFTCHNTRRYVECLPKLVASYNNTFHCSNGMTPIEASKPKNENFVLQWLYGQNPSKPSAKFKLNVSVRISRYHCDYDKGYLLIWSEEYYRILEIKNTKLPAYKICDMLDEPLTRTFYRHKLQKILIDPNAMYRIEKLLKTGRVDFCRVCGVT